MAFKPGTTNTTFTETSADKKQRVAAEGRKALAHFEVEANAIRKNMAKLRELRLAKEAADLAEELANPQPKPEPRKKRATAAKKTVAIKKAVAT